MQNSAKAWTFGAKKLFLSLSLRHFDGQHESSDVGEPKICRLHDGHRVLPANEGN